MKGITSIPQEVMCDILDFIPVAEVMKFRGLCTWTKTLVTVYQNRLQRRLGDKFRSIHTKKELQYVTENMKFLPYPNIQIGFDLNFSSEHTQNFANELGFQIRMLKIPKFIIQMTKEELDFFEKFSSLTCLHVEEVVVHRNLYKTLNGTGLPQFRLPTQIMINLENLRFDLADDPFGVDFLLSHCANLKLLNHGIVSNPHIPDGTESIDLFRQILTSFISHIKQRRQNLKSHEMTIVFEPSVLSIKQVPIDHFVLFVKLVSQENIKIEGFPVELLTKLLNLPSSALSLTELERFAAKIKTLNGFSPPVCNLMLPNLNKLSYKICKKDLREFKMEFSKRKEINLPRLEAVDIFIAMKTSRTRNGRLDFENLTKILRFMLDTRRHLRQLKINATTRRHFYLLPCQLVSNFSSLRKVNLDIKFYSSKEFTCLFNELGEKTHINWLKIRVYKGFNETMFIGACPKTPVFLKMTRE